jgi:hypothetical protein
VLGATVGRHLNVMGNYIEVWCVSSATRVSHVAGRIGFLVSECLLLYFLKVFGA